MMPDSNVEQQNTASCSRGLFLDAEAHSWISETNCHVFILACVELAFNVKRYLIGKGLIHT